MTVPDIPLSSILASDILAQEALMLAYAAEIAPSANFDGGPLRDNVVVPSAILTAHIRTYLQYVEQRRSLLTLASQTNPDPAAVTEAASLYRLTAQSATPSQGSVAIVRNTNFSMVIPIGTQFTVNGVVYATTQTYVAKSEPALIQAATDLLISQVNVGQYQFSVPVQSTGSTVTIPPTKGTAMTVNLSISGLLSVSAASNFSAGTSAESASSLLGRVLTGVAAPSPATRSGIAALIADASIAAGIPAPTVSVVGVGDPELRPLSVGPWPIVTAGRSDIYIRPVGGPVHQTVITTCTYAGLDQTGVNGLWTVVIGSALVPGFYQVASAFLIPATGLNSTNLQLVTDTRPAPTGSINYGPNNGWVYSADQTAVLQFSSAVPASSVTVGSKQQINIDFIVPAGLQAATAAVLDSTMRGPVADLVVRAAIPCFTQVSLEISGSYDTGAAVAAVISAVEASKFSGRLTVARISAAVQAAIAGDIVTVGIFGKIRRPDGTMVYLTDSGSELTIPDDPLNGITEKTVAFYTSLTDVTITGV